MGVTGALGIWPLMAGVAGVTGALGVWPSMTGVTGVTGVMVCFFGLE